MDAIPTLELLTRHSEHVPTPACLLGAPAMPADWPDQDVHAVTTHFGHWEAHGGHAGGWYFGYDDDAIPERFNLIVLFMPKAKTELAMRCAWASDHVAPGGEIWLVGARREGIAGGAKRFSEQYPRAFKADSARHCQLWKVRAPETQDATAFRVEDWLRQAPVSVVGETLELFSLPGLFSEGRLDAGTEMLLQTLEERPLTPVLDFACGNGIIGAWLLQRWPDLKLTLCDVQWQALRCAQRALSVEGQVQVLASDGLSRIEPGYGAIITNPPFHQGMNKDSAVTETMLRQAAGYLVSQGELRLVANAFLPYPNLFGSAFTEPTVLAGDGRYRVYSARRRQHSPKK